MNCPKCGKELPEGVTICDACSAEETKASTTENVANENTETVRTAETGEAVVETAVNENARTVETASEQTPATPEQPAAPEQTPAGREPQATPIQPPVPPAAQSPKKKSPVVLICVLAGVVVVGLLVAFNFAYVKNAALRLFLSSDNYAKYIVKSNFDHSKELAELYAFQRKADRKVTTTLSVELADDAVDELGGYVEAGIYDGPELEGLSNLSVSWTVAGKGNLVAINGDLFAEDESLGTIETLYDSETHMFYGRVPQCNEDYFAIDLSDYLSRAEIKEVDKFAEAVEELEGVLPAPKELQSIMKRYLLVAVTEIRGVKEKDTQIEACGVKQRCVSLSLTLDDELFADVVTAVLKEMADDEELKGIIRGFEDLEFMPEVDMDFEDMYEDAVDDALDAAEDISFDEEIEITLYVSAKGEVIGAEMAVEADGEAEISVLSAQKGKNYGFEAFFIDDEEEIFRVEGEGTKTRNGITADYSVETPDGEFAFRVENMILEHWVKGELKGKFIVELGDYLEEYAEEYDLEDLFEDASFQINADITPARSNVSFALMNGDEEYASLRYTQEITDTGTLVIPEDKDVITMRKVGNLLEYADGCHFDFIKDAAKTLGLPKEVRDELEDALDEFESGIGYLESIEDDKISDYGDMAEAVKVLGYLPLAPKLVNTGTIAIFFGALAPQAVKYTEKAGEASSLQNADSIAVAIKTALCDPDVMASGGFDPEDYDHWTYLSTWDVDDCSFTEVTAEFLGIDDFSEIEDEYPIRDSGATGEYLVWIDGYTVYVLMEGTTRGDGMMMMPAVEDDYVVTPWDRIMAYDEVYVQY